MQQLRIGAFVHVEGKGMMNDERWTINVEWLTLNDERWTINDERLTINGEWWTGEYREFFRIRRRFFNHKGISLTAIFVSKGDFFMTKMAVNVKKSG